MPEQQTEAERAYKAARKRAESAYNTTVLAALRDYEEATWEAWKSYRDAVNSKP